MKVPSGSWAGLLCLLVACGSSREKRGDERQSERQSAVANEVATSSPEARPLVEPRSSARTHPTDAAAADVEDAGPPDEVITGAFASLSGTGSYWDHSYQLELDAVEGVLDEASARTALDTVVDDLDTCLVHVRDRDPALSLRLNLAVRDGIVGSVKTMLESRSATAETVHPVSAELARCVAAVVEKARFLERAGATAIRARMVRNDRSARDPKGGRYVEIGVATVRGDLDPPIIGRYLRLALPRFHACYEEALVNQPALAGAVRISFTISADGRVRQATASGLMPAVADCIAAVVRRMQLPRPRGGGVVEVASTLTFKP